MANPNLKENKLKRAIALPFRGVIKTFFPKAYIKLQYKYITHHKLNLDKPTYACLKRLFINTVGAMSKMNGKDFYKIKGMDRNSILGLINALRKAGFNELARRFFEDEEYYYNNVLKNKKN